MGTVPEKAGHRVVRLPATTGMYVAAFDTSNRYVENIAKFRHVKMRREKASPPGSGKGF